MLPKHQRINLSTENFTREVGVKKIRSEHCLWFVKAANTELVSEQTDYFRFGISVSTRVSKRAVVRNTIRRQVLAYIQLHQEKLRDLEVICIVFRCPKQLESVKTDIELFFKQKQNVN